MYLNEKVLFIHIPKTGGSSITAFLKDIYGRNKRWKLYEKQLKATDRPPQHCTLQEVIRKSKQIGIKDIRNLGTVFVCVRNPYDLILSSYFWSRKRAAAVCSDAIRRGNFPDVGCSHESIVMRSRVLTFREFVLGAKYAPKDIYEWTLRWPQEEFFLVNGKKPEYLKIIKFENMEKDVRKLFKDVPGVEKISFPRMKVTGHEHWKEFYDAEMEETVFKRHRWVFENGLYKRASL